MSVPEYKGRKARQAFCHLDPGIRPEFSTLKGFAATFKHLDGFFQPISSPTQLHHAALDYDTDTAGIKFGAAPQCLLDLALYLLRSTFGLISILLVTPVTPLSFFTP